MTSFASRARRLARGPGACATLLACGSLSPSLHAATPDDAPAVAAVTVSASRVNARLQDMPLHTTVLGREDIERSPAQTLDQLLRQVPGLLVPGTPAYTTDPTGQNIRLRGMDKKVLVLVDGVPVLDPFYTTIQWFKVPLSSVERVEIVRGGGSSLWGNLAVGGVINIVTRHPRGGEGEAMVSYGSRQTWHTAISQAFPLSEALSLSLSADRFSSDGYNSAQQAYRGAYWPGRGASSATADNVRLGLDFQPSAGTRGQLQLGYHRQDERIGGYDWGHNVQESPDVRASITHAVGADARLSANAWAQRVQFGKHNGAGCYTSATYRCGAPIASPAGGATAAEQASSVLPYASSYDDNRYREQGASLVYTQKVGEVLREWQVGLDVRHLAGEDFQQSFRTPTAALPAVARIQRRNEGAGQQAFTGLFSQLRLAPTDALEVTLAGRVDHFRNDGGRALQTSYSNVANPVAAAPTGGAVPGLGKTAFDPSVSVRYALDDDAALRGAVYKAFRAPGLNNLYRSFGSSSITIANPLLAPETLVGKELGMDWQRGPWRLGVTAFQADVKDVVATHGIAPGGAIPDAVQAICGAGYTGTANAACPGTVSFYTNGQDQRAQGLELTGGWQAAQGLAFNAFATWTRTHYTRTTTGDPTHVQLPLVPRVVAGGSVAWRVSDRWQVDADVRHNGGMLLSGLTTTPALRQGGYTTVNLGASMRIVRGQSLFLSVVNATDKAFTDSSANNRQSIALALPRTATLGWRAQF